MTKWIFDGVEFKVGDKVRVVRATNTREYNAMGQGINWNNSWNREMDDAIGIVGTIKEISVAGVIFKTVDFDSILNFVSYPLSSLEKLNVLPDGDLGLIGKDGIKYEVQRSSGIYGSCSSKFSVTGRYVNTYVTDAEITSGIESGFWAIFRSEEIAAKEKLLAAIEVQMQRLITEKNKLEKELAQ